MNSSVSNQNPTPRQLSSSGEGSKMGIVNNNWEDILAIMDRRSESLRSADKLSAQPLSREKPSSMTSRSTVQRNIQKKPCRFDLMSSTGLPLSAFAPVNDDEESVADDYEGYSEYAGSSRLSTNKKLLTLSFSSNSQKSPLSDCSPPGATSSVLPDSSKSSRPIKSLSNNQQQTSQTVACKNDAKVDVNLDYLSRPGVIKSKDKVKSRYMEDKKQPKEENNTTQTSLRSKVSVGKPKQELDEIDEIKLLGYSRKGAKKEEPQSNQNNELTRKDSQRRGNKKPRKSKASKKDSTETEHLKNGNEESQFGNRGLEQALRDMEATIMSITPEGKLSPHPKSPNFVQFDSRSPKLSASGEKNQFWKNEKSDETEIYQKSGDKSTTSSNYQPNSSRKPSLDASEYTSQYYCDEDTESDVIKVAISKSTPRLFSKVNHSTQQISTNRGLPRDKILSKSFDQAAVEKYNRIMCMRSDQFYDPFLYGSDKFFTSAPISANESAWSSQHHSMNSSRSSSIWSKYDDIEDRNIAIYSQVLRKYGQIMDLESPRVSHIEKNKMDPTGKISSSKSYALDHAKRVLVRLKHTTGKDFELLHEKEIEDELISGVEPPKKLPPLGVNDPIEIEIRSFYKPRTVKDYKKLPKVQNQAGGSQYPDEERLEKVKKIEKLKQLDQVIRDRNKHMLSSRRDKSTDSRTSCEIQATSN